MILRSIRKHKKAYAIFMLLLFISGSFNNKAYALTSGPAQPETQQFTPAGMDKLVDPFTGDFSYNIPLLDVGGYPLNLNYASGISPDQEASWVGLGWNLNVGSINRNVRGLPDDFSGESLTKDYYTKPNQTYGVTGKLSFEIFGAKIDALVKANLGLSANLFYNNYNGFGMSMGVSPSLSAGLSSRSPFTAKLGLASTLSSEAGLEVTPTVGLQYRQQEGDESTTIGTSVGFPFSSREGLKGMTMSSTFSATTQGTAVQRDDHGNEISPTYSQTLVDGSWGAYHGFASPTFTPAFQHDMYNENVSINFTYTPTNPPTEPPIVGFGGYYSSQSLKTTSRSTPAYGYMYSGLNPSDDKILDFNREKDGNGYNESTANLPVTNYTYDIFQVSGQGVGGTFRLHRGDVGSVHDTRTTNDASSTSIGLELGFGPPPSAKAGLDFTYNATNGFSGRWPDNNPNINHFGNENTVNQPAKEAVYFKQMGELSPESDVDFVNRVQKGYGPMSHELTDDGESIFSRAGLSGSSNILTGNYKTDASDKKIYNDLRSKRSLKNTSFTPLTVEDAKRGAVLPIQNYALNDFTWGDKSFPDVSLYISDTDLGYPKTNIPRDGAGRKPYHISEIRVTQDEGKRYIYGIPVYNTSQQDVTFAKPRNGADVSLGLISYTPGADDVPGNKNGLDEYYNKVSTPPYATSYLLTCILSADYLDRDNIPGPSDGDMGTYTKFNYTKVTEQYQWRTPYSKTGNEASFSEGMHGDDAQGNGSDDKASYVYGTKEVWYLHSIETRTHVAEFYLGDRNDGLGAAGPHGGVDQTNKLKYLDKVVLYSKADKYNSSPTAIKTVHFEYDYSLCPNTLNSSVAANPDMVNSGPDGKLTLRKVWFTYGNSQKGILNPYVFNYADIDFDGKMEANLNPGYHFKNYDRWGNYKKNNLNGMNNEEYPYSLQDKAVADSNAAVWALTSIQTPTGGTIRVYYEADDYAYVQNRQAMRMFQVTGTASVDGTGNVTEQNDLFSDSYLVVDLGEGFTPSSTAQTGTQNDQEFRRKYLSGIDMMYNKMLLKVLAALPSRGERNEYVPGYVPIDTTASRLVGSSKTGNTYKKAVIKLKSVDGNNPIARNGWMFARLYLNRALMGSATSTDGGLKEVLGALISQASAIAQFFGGFEAEMKLEKNAQTFDGAHSFVRLNEPDRIKLGGGHRVKTLLMSDNWSQMKSGKESAQGLPQKETSYYGQSYDYTYRDNNGQVYSAGVAAYEPLMGGEENPFRMPVFVKEDGAPLAPSKEYYLEEPFGESFFPAPIVGYRKVSITPLKVTDPSAGSFKGNGTGRIEHEFYTAYDFPSITRRTKLEPQRYQPNILFQFMKFDCKDLVTCSQGYYVELNDMHGKYKAQREYSEPTLDANGNKKLDENKPIAEVEYRYRRNADGTLNNIVPFLIQPDLSLIDSSEAGATPLGVEVDVVQDERYSETSTLGGGGQFNLKYIQVVLVPVFIPTLFPDFNSEETRFRSVVTTKVVHKYGILASTTVKENGATVTTTNLGWDVKTGQVLLTSKENEFHDKVYSFTYPGHWAYARMDLSGMNESAAFNSSGFSTSDIKSILKDGDEIICKYSSKDLFTNNVTTWDTIAYCVADASGNKSLIDLNGQSATILSGRDAKIIRSGGRNIAATPVGSIISLDNPLAQGKDELVFSRVLESDVNEYKDGWKRACGCGEGDIISDNDFIMGLRGNIRPFRSWSYLTERTQTLVNDNPNTRTDGYFTDFSKFWSFSSSAGFIKPPASPGKWQFFTEVQNYNSNGMELEEKDVLNRFSMAQYGYGRTLPLAVTTNSMYQEAGFDGFEDYDFFDCENNHFYLAGFSDLTNAEAHTGFKAVQVVAGDSIYTGWNICNPQAQETSCDDEVCLPSFAPIPGKKYVISAWVKEAYTSNSPYTYSGSGIKVKFDWSESAPVFRAKGPIIEGWQRVEATFKVPDLATVIYIILLNDGAPGNAYFDDVRMHPLTGNMKSYVYDPSSRKVLAEMDENNYSTRYEYDDEGVLIRVKKETSKGISTIKETRMNQSKISSGQ